MTNGKSLYLHKGCTCISCRITLKIISANTESPDLPLLAYDDAVDRALDRAKAWSKYAKDVSAYVERRASMETEFAKSIAKLAHSVQQSLSEGSNLPFQSILSTALDLDCEYAHKCQSTQQLIQTHKFVEPLNIQRVEHDKTRKTLKDMWSKENRRMVRARVMSHHNHLQKQNFS